MGNDEDTKTGGVQATGSPFQFQLRNGKRFTGYIDASNDVKLLIIGNQIKLPPNAIRSISFDGGSQGRVRVALMNGDGLSGQLMEGQFKVMAEWGELKINNNALTRVNRVKASSVRRSRPDRTPHQVGLQFAQLSPRTNLLNR